MVFVGGGGADAAAEVSNGICRRWMLCGLAAAWSVSPLTAKQRPSRKVVRQQHRRWARSCSSISPTFRSSCPLKAKLAEYTPPV